MKHPIKYALYDEHKSYEENYAHGPFFDEPIPPLKRGKSQIKLWDFELNSPLGIPAGPLLNSNWIKLYGQLGFDIPTYKTVRSVEHPCHPNPNCVFVDPGHQLQLGEIPELTTIDRPKNIEELSITNSFGVPAKPATEWMADIKVANQGLASGQVMVVSFMGTHGAGGRDFVEDSAYTAAMVKEAGAKIMEVNYSCPNLVGSKAGAIYQDPENSALVSKAIRAAIGPNQPFMIKIGNLPYQELKAVVKANLPYINGIAGINTMPGLVRRPDGTQALPGEGRLKSGICGQTIRSVSQNFVENLVKIRTELGADFVICGVGGMMSAEDFDQRLDAGADIVMSATAIMWDPWLAKRWHER